MKRMSKSTNVATGQFMTICPNCNEITPWREWTHQPIGEYHKGATCPKCNRIADVALTFEGWQVKNYLLQNSDRDEWLKA